MKKNILKYALFSLVVASGLLLYAGGRELRNGTREETGKILKVFPGRHEIKTEIADTEEERSKGLSGRTSLCSDCGMLFVFPQKENQNFWMKDMLFDLDIIWIAGGKIIGISKRVSHERGDLEIVRSPVPVDGVLEINAGKSDEWGLKTGDEVRF